MDFAKGQRKDDVMRERLVTFTGDEGVVLIGRAQDKTRLFRTEKRRDGEGKSYPWIVASTGAVNQFYFYCVDVDFGPFFIKFGSYFPCNAKLCLNGNHWAQRQAAKAGVGFTPLDNAFAAVEDPAALEAISDRLGPGPDRRVAAQVAGDPARTVNSSVRRTAIGLRLKRSFGARGGHFPGRYDDQRHPRVGEPRGAGRVPRCHRGPATGESRSADTTPTVLD